MLVTQAKHMKMDQVQELSVQGWDPESCSSGFAEERVQVEGDEQVQFLINRHRYLKNSPSIGIFNQHAPWKVVATKERAGVLSKPTQGLGIYPNYFRSCRARCWSYTSSNFLAKPRAKKHPAPPGCSGCRADCKGSSPERRMPPGAGTDQKTHRSFSTPIPEMTVTQGRFWFSLDMTKP